MIAFKDLTRQYLEWSCCKPSLVTLFMLGWSPTKTHPLKGCLNISPPLPESLCKPILPFQHVYASFCCWVLEWVFEYSWKILMFFFFKGIAQDTKTTVDFFSHPMAGSVENEFSRWLKVESSGSLLSPQVPLEYSPEIQQFCDSPSFFGVHHKDLVTWENQP